MSDAAIPLETFCSHHRVDMGFLQDLQEYGLIELTLVDAHYFLPQEQLGAAEKWIRLHSELDVNIEGLDVIRHLVARLEAARDELVQLRSELRFYRGY
jgi:hypothetical protein